MFIDYRIKSFITSIIILIYLAFHFLILVPNEKFDTAYKTNVKCLRNLDIELSEDSFVDLKKTVTTHLKFAATITGSNKSIEEKLAFNKIYFNYIKHIIDLSEGQYISNDQFTKIFKELEKNYSKAIRKETSWNIETIKSEINITKKVNNILMAITKGKVNRAMGKFKYIFKKKPILNNRTYFILIYAFSKLCYVKAFKQEKANKYYNKFINSNKGKISKNVIDMLKLIQIKEAKYIFTEKKETKNRLELRRKI